MIKEFLSNHFSGIVVTLFVIFNFAQFQDFSHETDIFNRTYLILLVVAVSNLFVNGYTLNPIKNRDESVKLVKLSLWHLLLETCIPVAALIYLFVSSVNSIDALAYPFYSFYIFAVFSASVIIMVVINVGKRLSLDVDYSIVVLLLPFLLISLMNIDYAKESVMTILQSTTLWSVVLNGAFVTLSIAFILSAFKRLKQLRTALSNFISNR